ncbi:conserved exported protein of unknown function [Methanocaldococcus lauensis]|uniref:Uncharacterized protein n=1 Tax=Methanocaldococcus lauensis TaxID=2546128 RepID=A0A8D6PTV2_9EURY|nr:hypothetical protein [Methanocaldococcus lauensis]CAB3289853.1 conserved exported protein of unknown function [Methanocaldococcus lauensis]
MINTKIIKMLILFVVLGVGVILSGCAEKQETSESGSSYQTSLSPSEESTELPIYPGSHENNQYNMWATMTGYSHQFSEFHSYVVEGASPTDIINWYKSKFPGYTVSQGTVNVEGSTIASLTLKKGNTIIGVMAFEHEGKTVYFVGKTAVSEENNKNTLPNHDMISGEEPLQRYPGSVMLSYTKSKDGNFPIYYDITYGTKDDYDKVVNWFKKTLTSKGWNITYQSGSSDSVEMVFEKDDDEVTVSIAAPCEGIDYTEITIYYTKRSIPNQDLARGNEPLPRYPGAVMIEYHNTTMTIQGQTSTEIKAVYLAPDSNDKVKQWYLEKLRKMFPNIYSDESSIDAGGYIGNKMVSVHIDFGNYKTYTEVSIDYIVGG